MFSLKLKIKIVVIEPIIFCLRDRDDTTVCNSTYPYVEPSSGYRFLKFSEIAEFTDFNESSA